MRLNNNNEEQKNLLLALPFHFMNAQFYVFWMLIRQDPLWNRESHCLVPGIIIIISLQPLSKTLPMKHSNGSYHTGLNCIAEIYWRNLQLLYVWLKIHCLASLGPLQLEILWCLTLNLSRQMSKLILRSGGGLVMTCYPSIFRPLWLSSMTLSSLAQEYLHPFLVECTVALRHGCSNFIQSQQACLMFIFCCCCFPPDRLLQQRRWIFSY